MKPFLLIAGSWYYPSPRTGDWIDTFSSREEALQKVKIDEYDDDKFTIDNEVGYDWYEIVDLREWINR